MCACASFYAFCESVLFTWAVKISLKRSITNYTHYLQFIIWAHFRGHFTYISFKFTRKEFSDNDGVKFAVEGLDKGHNLGTPAKAWDKACAIFGYPNFCGGGGTWFDLLPIFWVPKIEWPWSHLGRAPKISASRAAVQLARARCCHRRFMQIFCEQKNWKFLLLTIPRGHLCGKEGFFCWS